MPDPISIIELLVGPTYEGQYLSHFFVFHPKVRVRDNLLAAVFNEQKISLGDLVKRSLAGERKFTLEVPVKTVIDLIASGKVPPRPKVRLESHVPAAQVNLTSTQILLLMHVADGLSNREIGECLGLSENAVKSRLHVLFKKIKVFNRLEAALFTAHYLQKGAAARQYLSE